nr:AAA family ATPase [Cytophagales bacterium]
MINRFEPLWQALRQWRAAHPSGPLHVFFKAAQGDFAALPLVFRNGEPRVQMETAVPQAVSLPEPAKTEFMRRYQADRLFSLAAACKHYFGPLHRPGRNSTYDPAHELQLSLDEIGGAFPAVREQFPYGTHVRLEKLAERYTVHSVETAVSVVPTVEDKETPYQVPAQLYPLNQILYGPPGTGKTYQTVNYAVGIVEGKPVADIQAEGRPAVQRRYEQYREQEQIEFITFHQSYSYEEFVQGLRPDTHRHTDGLQFRLVDGVFKRIADRARANYENYRRAIHRPTLPFEALLDQMLTAGMNRETEEVEILLQNPGGQFKSLIVYEASDTVLKYKRRTNRDAVRDEERTLLIHKMRERFYGRDIREAINRPYYEAVVQALRKFEKGLKHAASENRLKHYVLVVDEINRANISRVLGELITLLEDDKRLGAENQLVVTLPSGEAFAVPPNLYVIGTMNTADKSVALLDVALRRRFAFVPVFPDYSLIPDFASILQALNAQIRDRRGVDFLIGHSYFIGKTLADLPDIFNRKIIPLLYEYFDNHTAQVREVLQ